MLDERRPPEELLHVAAHQRHARRAADRDDLVDVGRLQARVLQRLPARPAGALDEVAHQRLELVARDRARHPTSRPACASSTSVRVASDSARFARSAIAEHLGADLRVRAQRLGQLARAADRRGARRCRRRRDACRRSSPAPRRRRARSLQDRDVEGAAAEVVHRDRALGALVRDRTPARPRSARSPAGAPRGRRAGPRPCVAWRWLSLKYAGTVMTACETGLAERGLGPALQLAQNVRRDLGRRDLAARDREADDALASPRRSDSAADPPR